MRGDRDVQRPRLHRGRAVRPVDHDATGFPEPDRSQAVSTLSLRLPESLHKRLKEMAEREGISINQFISTAVAEKLSALMTVEYLEERASRGDRARFDAVLAKIA